MSQSPYNEARRVFWIVDNGSSHRGARAVARLKGRHRNLELVHGPVHASWLNQIEIYFSILQRNALTPNDFPSLLSLENRLISFQQYYEKIATPFERGNLQEMTLVNCSRRSADLHRQHNWPRSQNNKRPNL